ncbi:Mor transcription activator family protein [Chromohalobacter israelensis]|uniref:Mor transcription activator family protein n=1 Tax=Chromohalobacter israelensis TaxID=141390 RepID=UPI00265C1149|nr:Mor transcription activator family protein [Chromohalobacter salexigens]MDO0944636.1 Mor transcription activator family protein [Chromohalobacter salexigens]
MGFDIPEDALERMLDPEILRKWPQGLADMLTVIESAHRRAGDDDETSRLRAFRAVRALAQFAGGRSFYVPKGERLDRALRDREIWEQFDGGNVSALAAWTKLTEAQIYSILAEQRRMARERIQPRLF